MTNLEALTIFTKDFNDRTADEQQALGNHCRKTVASWSRGARKLLNLVYNETQAAVRVPGSNAFTITIATKDGYRKSVYSFINADLRALIRANAVEVTTVGGIGVIQAKTLAKAYRVHY